MSTFDVKLRMIQAVEPHPNADRLSLAVIGGYRAVIKKDEFKVGDLALYLPTDSLFTDISIAEKLGVAAYLTGKYKNRVKAVKLRGVLSEGIVIPYDTLAKYIADNCTFDEFHKYLFYVFDGEEFGELLKIEKYEEPIPIEMAGHVRPWPTWIPKYDIESLKRPECMNVLTPGEEVIVTEKMHGTNSTFGLDEDNIFVVCSRNLSLEESEYNVYWRIAREQNLKEKLTNIKNSLNCKNLAIRGEIVGVQDYLYALERGSLAFFAFDLFVDGQYVNFDVFKQICNLENIQIVPLIFRGQFDREILFSFADGPSLVPNSKNTREGIVIKPITERNSHQIGRVQVKVVGETYLTRKEGTELH